MAKPYISKTKNGAKNLPFEQARELAREEMIGSISQYHRWWDLNTPSCLPKRPDRAYRNHGWSGWNDFLGNNNESFGTGKRFRPFEKARSWARRLGIPSREGWFQYLRENEKPEDIPTRPDVVYNKSGEWVSWKNWLIGRNASEILEEFRERPILYILDLPSSPSNVLKINVTYGGKERVIEGSSVLNAKIVGMYYLDDNQYSQHDWFVPVQEFGNQYTSGQEDEFMFYNVAKILGFYREKYDMVG